MGFREDLSLPHLRDYDWVFKEFAGEEGENNEGVVPVIPAQRNPSAPFLVGNGPDTASTTTALALIYPPYHCWDNNGWYRVLGIKHTATRKQLKQAYLDNSGAASERMTYAMSMLLDPETRREYDLLGLGEYNMEDPFWQKAVKERAVAEALLRGADPADILREWGMEVGPPPPVFEDSPQVLLDESENYVDNDVYDGWYYAWFAWRVDESYADLAESWQLELIRAARGESTRITVGIMESVHPYSVEYVDGKPVVFLSSTSEPSAFAESALQLLYWHLSNPKDQS